jgi:hypothetical protein
MFSLSHFHLCIQHVCCQFSVYVVYCKLMLVSGCRVSDVGVRISVDGHCLLIVGVCCRASVAGSRMSVVGHWC